VLAVPLVVLDTNILWEDVEAAHGGMQIVLDGARRGDFELAVPSVVLDELTRQYPQRVKKVRRAIRKAVSDSSDEMRRLGLTQPVAYEPEMDGVAYRERITKILSDAGATFPDAPNLAPALGWAIAPRKPFKESGEGLPDAAIWLTVLELCEAAKPRRVIFISTNHRDFGNGGTPMDLADELRQDLVDRGLPKQMVRYLTGLDRFIETVAKPLSTADSRASRQLASTDTRDTIVAALERRLDFATVPEEVADLGATLFTDLTVVSYDVRGDLELTDAAELDGGSLSLSLSAPASVTVEAAIPREVAYVEEDVLRARIVDDDFSEHAVEITADLELRLRAELLLRNPGSDSEDVEITDLTFELAPEERVERALTDHLVSELRSCLDGFREAPEVEDYIPDELVYSELQGIALGDIRAISVREASIDDRLGPDEYAIRLEIDAEADVHWHATLSDARDASEHPADDEEAGYLRQGVDFASPLTLEVTAVLEFPETLREVSIERAVLQEAERKRRQEYLDHHDPETQLLEQIAKE
jgi:predicted nucleic acid-binding protein